MVAYWPGAFRLVPKKDEPPIRDLKAHVKGMEKIKKKKGKRSR